MRVLLKFGGLVPQVRCFWEYVEGLRFGFPTMSCQTQKEISTARNRVVEFNVCKTALEFLDQNMNFFD
jgi:hypothetical protein